MTPVREALELARKRIEYLGSFVHSRHQTANEKEFFPVIDTAIASLSAAPGEPCAVKPLEWVDEPNREPENPAWNASNPFGLNYRIFKAWWGARDKWAFMYGSCFHHTVDEAKASAQADYEQRIRSALVVTTPQPAAGWDEAIGTAVRLLENSGFRGSSICDDMKALRREAPAPAEGEATILAGLNLNSGTKPDTAESRLREALERIASDHTQYDWPIDATSGEAMTHVAVQMREIARQALSPPSGGDEAKESEGEGKVDSPTALADKGQPRIHAHGVATVGTLAANMDSIGVSPSEPSPPADRREIVWFDTVLQKLKDWRSTDHEDNILLSRHEVCTILDQFAILAALDGGR